MTSRCQNKSERISQPHNRNKNLLLSNTQTLSEREHSPIKLAQWHLRWRHIYPTTQHYKPTLQLITISATIINRQGSSNKRWLYISERRPWHCEGNDDRKKNNNSIVKLYVTQCVSSKKWRMREKMVQHNKLLNCNIKNPIAGTTEPLSVKQVRREHFKNFFPTNIW